MKDFPQLCKYTIVERFNIYKNINLYILLQLGGKLNKCKGNEGFLCALYIVNATHATFKAIITSVGLDTLGFCFCVAGECI